MRDARPAAAAALLVLAFGVFQALAANVFPDLFIYRYGAELGLRSQNPYDTAAIRSAVAVQFPEENPDENAFVNNCGFFLPPGAVAVFAPFAALPWPNAKLLWGAVNGLAAFVIARVIVLFRPAGQPTGPDLVRLVLPFILVLNFLTVAVVMVGQTAVVAAGGVIAGLVAFGRGWNIAGAILWALPFVKPHVALPLLPLAWYLGGWKRAAAVAAVVGGLNLMGAFFVGGSPLFLRDYVTLVGAGHKGVVFNLAERAYEMTSWNRLLFVIGGERWLVEQSAGTMLLSYAVGFGLVLARCLLAWTRPSETWALAMAAALSVVCPQVLGYELVGLVLAVPWVRDLFAAERRGWGLTAVLLLGAQLIPFQTADAIGIDWHRPAGAMAFAVLVLAGPLRPAGRSPEAVG
ncbi:MAG TPA: glycosyltransferase family 87 protein [Urbifossiella sp.]|nr:glycosyltransferase family 87 protein [Urbifossiella sp.]